MPEKTATARRAGLCAAALALVLSACTVNPQRTSATLDTAAETASGEPALKDGELVGLVGSQPAPRPPLAAASRALLDAPENLDGLDREGLRAALGEPALLRRDPPAEIWQYRSGSCVLDVVLYEGEGVAHAEARSRPTAEATAIPACLQALLAPPARTLETAER